VEVLAAELGRFHTVGQLVVWLEVEAAAGRHPCQCEVKTAFARVVEAEKTLLSYVQTAHSSEGCAT